MTGHSFQPTINSSSINISKQMTDILYPQEPAEQVAKKRKESLVSVCIYGAKKNVLC
jgi:hypothetical protein